MKRIYLIDCPGVVPPSQSDSEEDILLRGVVRVENVEHPAQYIEAVLRRTQTKHIERTYELREADYGGDPIEFLSILARKSGRLLKGGEPDVDGVAKMVLNDFLRGKIPWFSAPPRKLKEVEAKGEPDEVVEGRKGQLGEMPGSKRQSNTGTGYPPVDDENDRDDVDEDGQEDSNLEDGSDGSDDADGGVEVATQSEHQS